MNRAHSVTEFYAFGIVGSLAITRRALGSGTEGSNPAWITTLKLNRCHFNCLHPGLPRPSPRFANGCSHRFIIEGNIAAIVSIAVRAMRA